MPTVLKMSSYDTIYHEPLEFYNLAVIEYILKQSGMKVFNVTLNDINGGNLRCYATHTINFRYRWSASQAEGSRYGFPRLKCLRGLLGKSGNVLEMLNVKT